MTTWRALFDDEMFRRGDQWTNVESMTLSESDLDADVDDSFGSGPCLWFTVWTRSRVYFPRDYDGQTSAESVSRHPDGKPTAPVGGGYGD